MTKFNPWFLILAIFSIAITALAQSPTISLATYASRFGDESRIAVSIPKDKRPLDVALDLAILRGRFRPGGTISFSPTPELTLTLGDTRSPSHPVNIPIAFPPEYLTGLHLDLKPKPNRFGEQRLTVEIGRFATLRGFWGRFTSLRETGTRLSFSSNSQTLTLASSLLIAQRSRAFALTARKALDPRLDLFSDLLISKPGSAAFTPGFTFAARRLRASALYAFTSGSPSRTSSTSFSHEPRGPSASISFTSHRLSATAAFARSASASNGHAPRPLDITSAALALRISPSLSLRASLTYTRTNRFGETMEHRSQSETTAAARRPNRFGTSLTHATIAATVTPTSTFSLEAGFSAHSYQDAITLAAETTSRRFRVAARLLIALHARQPQLAEGHRFSLSASVLTRPVTASFSFDIRRPNSQSLISSATAANLALSIPLPSGFQLTASLRHTTFTSPFSSTKVPEARISLSIPFLSRRGNRPEAIIEGRVITEDNSPVPNVLIMLDDGQNVYTDRDGRFRFYTSPGRHTITLDTDSLPSNTTLLSPKSQPATARAENPPPITFRLRRTPKPEREFIFKSR